MAPTAPLLAVQEFPNRILFPMRFLPSVSSWGPVLAGLLLLSLGFLPLPLSAQTSETEGAVLSLRVTELPSENGTVRISLNDAQNYDGDGAVRAAVLPIESGEAHWTVDDIGPGRYAVQFYHDENDNGELDTNMFGAPQEAYGFSEDAEARFSRPDFEEAAFTLSSDSLSTTITAQ